MGVPAVRGYEIKPQRARLNSVVGLPLKRS